MAFDLSTAKPVAAGAPGGFDLSSAKPVAYTPSAADLAMADPTAGMSTFGKLAAGYGKAGADLVQGIGQRIGQVVGPTATQALGLPTQADVDETRRLDAPLMATRAGTIGHVVGSVVDSLPAAAIPFANTIVGAAAIGAGLGLAQPTATGDSSKVLGMNVGSPVAANALSAALLGAGAVGAGKLIGAGANRLMAASGQPAGKAAAVQAAQAAGFKLPPADINPSTINQLTTGLAGNIKTQQVASAFNQPVVNTKIAAQLGLPEGTTITPDLLASIRKTVGQAYEDVRGTGDVTASPQFQAALNAIGSKYQGASASFPGLAKPEVSNMIEALNQPNFRASDAVDAIGVLRDKADQAFRAGDKSLGTASKSAADALESELGRHMTDTGQDPALIDAFRGARKTIAQTYTVQNALNPTTGDVSAAYLAKQLSKGKPLSGDMQDIAQSAAAFPKSFQTLSSNPTGVSAMDYLAGVAGSHNMLSAGLNATVLGARPLLRSALMSDVGQRLATPSANTTPNALLQLLSGNTTPGALVGQARRSTSATVNQNSRNP